MSKVVAEYDTETKELVLTIDGQKTEKVVSINMYSYDEPMYDGKTEKYGHFEARFEDLSQNGIKYCMSAYGSKIESTEAISDYLTKSLLKK